MSGVKRTPADAAFSKCIRERAGWFCERCRKYFPEGLARMGLDCSHHFSRGNWSVRLDPANAESLCYGCHSHYGGTEERMREIMGEGEIEILREKKNDTNLGKLYRKTKGKGDIAKHYRNELKRMQELRNDGIQGRIEFEAYF